MSSSNHPRWHWLRRRRHTRLMAADGGDAPAARTLFSDQQLRDYARLLAKRYPAQRKRGSDRLAQWLAADEAALDRAFAASNMAAAGDGMLEPAAEWLIDNFYVIKEQIKEIRAGLPKAYWRELPVVVTPDDGEVPRILLLMRELAAHVDGRVHANVVRGFVDAYQHTAPLTLGELWAIPLMLRLALVEQLRPLANAISQRLKDTAAAATWSQRLLDTARTRPADLVLVLADMARARTAMSPAWVAEFHRRIQGGNPALSLAMVWLEQQLSAQHLSIGGALERESRAQAAAQVSISNCIGSMRVVGRTEWADVVEELSAIEAELRRDPARVYADMDFTTRDRYRHVVEHFARRNGETEWDVAKKVIERAEAAEVEAEGDARRRHVGYWLVGRGRLAMERQLGVHFELKEWIPRLLSRFPAWFYVGPIILLTVAIAALGIPGVEDFGRVHAVLVIAALLVAASHFSVTIINWTSTLSVAPQTLCRMDLDDGIPDALRTLVAVPCMLSSEAEVDELVSALEIRYLANRDPNLFLALVSDFVDAPEQTMPGDAALLARAKAGIEALNKTHEPDAPPRFCLLHRQRLWNAGEHAWIGRERKRGKLAELNNFLRGEKPDDCTLVVGDAALLQRVNFVIALDADTELPPQSAHRLVATLAHPLNRPRLDHAKRRVVEGYGVLQPRVSVGASRGVTSALARLYSDEVGLDPYTRLVSDVYQDLYSEASYVGKGIYDVDAFRAVTGSRFPDNLILSHDLLEGSYARTGLVSDVELLEQHPERYDTDARRRHRWTRGDWQVAAWLLPWVPGPRGRWLRNTLSSHHRWKLLDNLRRSLVPPALLVLLLNAWLLSSKPLYWTALVLAVIFASPLLISIDHFLARNPRMEWGLHFRLNWEAMLRRLQQTALLLAMLAFEACHSLDAIGRSVWRMLVSHRYRLQWTPASELARRSAHTVGAYYRMMWPAPVLAVIVAALLLARDVPTALIAGLFLLLWSASPWLACALSRPSRLVAEVELDAAQRAFLGVMARRTWHFFDISVTAEHHWLPPDNFQEYPREQMAERTSPTNIGMYLVSALSAGDFGYLTQPQVLQRVEATLDSLEQLRRYHGHCFNWYDTISLQPLSPAYVSSVDSGNLLGCLLVLARGLTMLDEERLLPSQVWRGLRDTWHVCVEVAAEHPCWPDAAAALIEQTLAAPPAAQSSLRAQAQTLADLGDAIDALVEQVGELEASPDAVVDGLPDDAGELALPWLRRLRQQCRDAITELAMRAPWLEHVADAPDDEALTALLERLDRNPSLHRAAVLGAGAARIDAAADAGINAVRSALVGLPEWLRARMHAAQALAMRCRALTDVDYRPLWVRNDDLLSIGYNVDQHSRDSSTYDLLASEARLTSFVGIAQGKLPREHWFALGRLLTIAAGRPALLSWSGSMFEYMMPLLLMPSFDNTLLTRTCHSVIARQIGYGREHGVPWGISESAYNITDAHFVYQYRAFGVPGLGFKRGLADDLVIAPYASALAAILRPDAACRNLRELHNMGASGRFGFYEAVDYSSARLPKGAKFALVRAYMAHHQGMIFTALSAALNERPLQKRFLREPMFRANQLLLQEKVPAALSIDASTLHVERMLAPQREVAGVARVITALDTSVPQVQLLSNGRYHTIISQTGGGYSQWDELAVNDWSEDGTRDRGGMYCYVQDLDRGALWSNTWQPTRAPAQHYAATFAQASAEFQRADHGIETQTRIAISSEDDIELRRVRLTNRSDTRRRLALTSYVEWVMTRRSDAQAHPAFNKLFVESEFIDEHNALLARRRPRGDDEAPPYFMHLMGVRATNIGPVSFETRRDVFIGRDRDAADPLALTSGEPLANTSGAVLDPIAALRREIALEPGQTATVDIITGVAPTREAALQLAARYADRDFGTRVFDLAWTREQVIRHQLNMVPGDVRLFTRLAGSVLYPDSAMRARAAAAASPGVGQSGLWKYGISGDLPIVLVRIGSIAELPVVRQALQAHVYWHMHGLPADLVVWNEDASGYRQELQDLIMGLISSSAEAPRLDRPGGVFVRRSEHVSLDDRTLLLATARVVLNGRHGSVAEQLPALEGRRTGASKPLKRLPPPLTTSIEQPRDLQLFNGTGGFSADGREYVMWLPPGVTTPLPWVNVLANPQFGTVISASGSAYSWNENAREFRLTPWYNDAVSDTTGEAFYLRDEASGAFWSPTPGPARGSAAYCVRHGFGYSVFETLQAQIKSTLTVFVATEQALKFCVLRVRNDSPIERSLSAFGFIEWVLGDSRSRCAPHVRTHMEADEHAVYASNHFSDSFARKVGLFATDADGASASGNRAGFIGRNRNLDDPLALHQTELDGMFGAGIDPCAAWQVPLTLAPGEEREVVFVLGVGADVEQARMLAFKYADRDAAAEELAAVQARWRGLLDRLTVQTPDPAINLLANGWLVYQVIGCRLWGRSGFYQSGGAYGFRDQLQDTVSLLAIGPTFAREQILRCASRQFVEGDVQHWWHPPLGRGVRTHFSDDYLWLPWAVTHYVEVTGDRDILDRFEPFLEGRLLGASEESYYDFAEPSASRASIYEHCTRALLRALKYGQHGLPLIGSGDWNDGFNRLGREGRGESVWLAFFLIDVLRRFAPLARARGDDSLYQRCLAEADGLAERIDANAWDGAWYRRAYADDGSVVGSSQSEECQIDSLPQSWASLTASGDPQRRAQALDSALSRLVHADAGVVQLFDPPFDTSALDPGYIKGYIPGTRENGGQYTHAAVWLGMACAAAGRDAAAWNLFDLINPLNHSRDAEAVDVYKVEPYVVAADVYWAADHRGRGGWTWYTGSAGWLYRFMTESLLGLHVRDGVLSVRGCVRSDWPGYQMRYQHGGSTYVIEVINRVGDTDAVAVSLDGVALADNAVPLVNDGVEHAVRVVVTAASSDTVP